MTQKSFRIPLKKPNYGKGKLYFLFMSWAMSRQYFTHAPSVLLNVMHTLHMSENWENAWKTRANSRSYFAFLHQPATSPSSTKSIWGWNQVSMGMSKLRPECKVHKGKILEQGHVMLPFPCKQPCTYIRILPNWICKAEMAKWPETSGLRPKERASHKCISLRKALQLQLRLSHSHPAYPWLKSCSMPPLDFHLYASNYI